MKPKIPDEPDEMDIFAQKNGFESMNQLTHMVARVDLTNPLVMREFIEWRETDGTKQGLERILQLSKTVNNNER